MKEVNVWKKKGKWFPSESVENKGLISFNQAADPFPITHGAK